MGTKGALTLPTKLKITKRFETNMAGMLTLFNLVVLHRNSLYYSLYFSILKSFIIKIKTFTE